MALSVGSRVYLDVNSGLRLFPPLFGMVDEITGLAPDVVRVNWENGASHRYTTADQNFNHLIDFAADGDENELLWKPVFILTFNKFGKITRSFFRDPTLTNVRTLLVQTVDGLWLVVNFTDIFSEAIT